MLGRWLAIGILGFTVGAATIVLADSGSGGGQVSAAPVASSGSASAVDASTGSAGAPVAHDHGGKVVTGVKAQDIAAESQPDVPLDAATRDQLAMQLAGARDVAMQYPTVADAEAAGFVLAGGFAPGSGAHYINYAGNSGDGAIDVTKVNSFIYDGVSPTSRIVGLMYYGNADPEGFAGPNDHWHRHSNVCVKFGGPTGIQVPFPADADVSREQCEGAGASLMPITGWMVHTWVVPGWESPEGVFSHENANVRCADGTYDTDEAGFCQGELTRGPVEPPPTGWELPDPADAHPHEEIVGVGADLEPATLLAAYRRGLFPMRLARGGPVAWWSPDPRGIIPLDGMVVHRSLRRVARRYSITVDRAFEDVMRGCADPSRPHGWIDESFIAAYSRLHELGWAHSIEVWDADDALVGGLYGLASGGLFAGESMFHRARDASKVALLATVDRLRAGGATLFDVQWCTDHLASLGAIEITRKDYLARVAEAITRPQLTLERPS